MHTHPTIKIIGNTPSRMRTNSSASHSCFIQSERVRCWVRYVGMYNNYPHICTWRVRVYFDFNVALLDWCALGWAGQKPFWLCVHENKQYIRCWVLGIAFIGMYRPVANICTHWHRTAEASEKSNTNSKHNDLADNNRMRCFRWII